MALRADELIASLNMLLANPDGQPVPYANAAHMQQQLGVFLGRFAGTCAVLESIARKELAQLALAPEETALIDNWMETLIGYEGRRYTGHYPGLFLRGNEGRLPVPPPSSPDNVTLPPPHDCNQADELVVDVLNAGPSDPDLDPGAVLHQGVGHVNLLMIAVDNGPDRMVYAGPVFSHYEFEIPLGQRLTDEAWKDRVRRRDLPTPPSWTESFLVRRP